MRFLAVISSALVLAASAPTYAAISADDGLRKQRLSGQALAVAAPTEVGSFVTSAFSVGGSDDGAVELAFQWSGSQQTDWQGSQQWQWSSDDNDDVTPVPGPAALPLMLTALGAFGYAAWRRKKG